MRLGLRPHHWQAGKKNGAGKRRPCRPLPVAELRRCSGRVLAVLTQPCLALAVAGGPGPGSPGVWALATSSTSSCLASAACATSSTRPVAGRVGGRLTVPVRASAAPRRLPGAQSRGPTEGPQEPSGFSRTLQAATKLNTIFKAKATPVLSRYSSS